MPENRSANAFNCAAIVLAAGRSSRFEGGHKLLFPLNGVPLIRRVMGEVAASPAGEIVLVVAPGGAISGAAGDGRWRTVLNDQADEGLASSIRAGFAALPANVDAAAIVLADMPGITSALIARAIAAAAANRDPRRPGAIVHPVAAKGRQGHPVVWPADLFPELMQLQGDKGAKALLAKHAARVVTIPPGDADPLADIDTRADLARFETQS